MTRVHLVLAVVVMFAMPVLSRWSANGGLAFTMFSGSGSYRLRISTTDHAGYARAVAPTAIAARLRGSMGDLLAGAESWRYAPYGPLIRRHLDEVASFGCAAFSGSRLVRVTVEERPTLDAPLQATTVTKACP